MKTSRALSRSPLGELRVLTTACLVWAACALALGCAPMGQDRAADLQALIDAAEPGDVVTLPPGTFEISRTLKLKPGIVVRGAPRAGAEPPATRLMWGAEPEGKALMRLLLYETGSLEVSDIEFVGSGFDAPGAAADVGLLVDGAVQDLRVHRNVFRRFGFGGVVVDGNVTTHPGQPTGVIYENVFSQMLSRNEDGDPNLGYGVSVYADGAAARPDVEWGEGAAIFIEDNSFEYVRHAVAANSNVHYVFRHNDVRNWWRFWGAVDAHGTSCCGRGARAFEIYRNTFEDAVHHDTGEQKPGWTTYLRGGDGVIFDNRVTQTKERYGGEFALTVEGFPDEDAAYPYKDQAGRAGPGRGVYFWDNAYRINDGPWREARLTVGVSNGLVEADDVAVRRRLLEGVVVSAPPPGYAPFAYPHPLRN